MDLRNAIREILLPDIQMPGQYLGGELNAMTHDPAAVRGRLALAFPDTYAIGMSHHGLQVLYQVMNRHDGWACERVFTPWGDMEKAMREHDLPLYGLESFTPLSEFDVLGFSLQYDLCYTNVLTMLDLGGVPLHGAERTLDDPLVIAGGPCVQNPMPMSRFIDVFVPGDGEAALPELCDAWLECRVDASDREEALRMMADRLSFAYVPRHPRSVTPLVVDDLDAVPLPTAPVVPNVEVVQDRIAIEIMRGCPGRCRFCQSTSIKRPIRFRSVETIVRAALDTYRNTGYNEISLLSLSTSDYKDFVPLMHRLREVFEPLGVSIAVPSLRVNEQLRTVAELLTTERRSGLTLAPEAARDEMRERIGKRISNDDLYEGVRLAFENGYDRVKLYFMCGLPGETQDDLDGIIEMSEHIARLGKEVRGRFPTVVANVSNFVPKPHTPFQWNGMQRRDYFSDVHRYLKQQVGIRAVKVKYHSLETSMLEALLCRGDEQVGAVIEQAWRDGARFDAWSDRFEPWVWHRAIEDQGTDVERLVHYSYEPGDRLPWAEVDLPQGSDWLEREFRLALI